MFYFSLAIFAVAAWVLPWWGFALIALALGFTMRASGFRLFAVGAGGAVAWASLAYVSDVRAHSLISVRMSSLFSLPNPALIFVVMAIIGGATAALNYQAGSSLRKLIFN